MEHTQIKSKVNYKLIILETQIQQRKDTYY